MRDKHAGPPAAGADAETAPASPADFGPSLAGLAQRYGLDVTAVRRLRLFGALIVQDEHAPTRVRAPVRVRDDHLADALVGLELPDIQDASMIADLGAGAGIPGIPLAIARPSARVTMVEGNNRKCEFIARAIGLLRLENATVVHGRAETWKDGIDNCEVVTALRPF
jgi:16S rRNA (guanine527-N7)-methyltransferase